MWKFASQAASGDQGPKNTQPTPKASTGECSDDEVSSCTSRDEGLECPICCESFNIVENIPYVLWCGHTLCKNCVLGLQWAVLKFPNLPIQLPFFISCPWCHILSLRLIYKGDLKFPCKNFFLLWMVESMNGDRMNSHSTHGATLQPPWPYLAGESHGLHLHLARSDPPRPGAASTRAASFSSYLNAERINSSLRKSLVFFVQLTAKFPLVVFFLIIVIYAVPASAAILVMYILVTILFAFPSFLVLYFAYPSLDWLVREILN